MTTRSNCKCSITGLTLEPDVITCIGGLVYHTDLLRAFVQKTGVLPNGEAPDAETLAAMGPGPVYFMPGGPPDASLQQVEFLHEQWHDLIISCQNSEHNLVHMFCKAKVIIGWLILTDTRSALELMTSGLHILETMEASGTSNIISDTLNVLLTSTLASVILGSSAARMLSDLDEHRIAGPPASTRTLDNAVLRYALAGLSDQLLSLLPE